MYLLKQLFWHIKYEDNIFQWALSRLLFYTGIGAFFTIDCGLYKIRFFPSALSLTKWLDPKYGANDEEFLRKILRNSDVVIDVGANIGTLTLASAALVGKQGRVIAFEPNTRTFDFLRKNVILNGANNVTLHNCAVGEKQGNVSFSDQKTDDQNKITTSGDLNVPLTTLDKQTSSIQGRIRLVKVDVEGYEKFVFMGAGDTLNRTDYIYFEVFEAHFIPLGYTTGELLRMLKQFNFCFYQIDERGKEIPIDTDFIPNKCMNIIGKREAI